MTETVGQLIYQIVDAPNLSHSCIHQFHVSSDTQGCPSHEMPPVSNLTGVKTLVSSLWEFAWQTCISIVVQELSAMNHRSRVSSISSCSVNSNDPKEPTSLGETIVKLEIVSLTGLLE